MSREESSIRSSPHQGERLAAPEASQHTWDSSPTPHMPSDPIFKIQGAHKVWYRAVCQTDKDVSSSTLYIPGAHCFHMTPLTLVSMWFPWFFPHVLFLSQNPFQDPTGHLIIISSWAPLACDSFSNCLWMSPTVLKTAGQPYSRTYLHGVLLMFFSGLA